MDSAQIINKNFSFQGLWTELASSVLYLSEVIWASTLFCILFNYPLQYLHVGFAFGTLGFIGYILSRVLQSINLNKNILLLLNVSWILIALGLFLNWVVFPYNQMGFFQDLIEPFINATSQTLLQSRLLQMVFALLLFRRGTTLANSMPHTWRAVRSFQLGMLMFVFFGLTTSWENIVQNLLPFILYLFTALIAMSTSRLSELVSNLGSRQPAFKKSWLLGIFSIAIATILLGTTVGWLFGITLADFSQQVINVIYGIGIVILMIIFSPLIALIALLLPWLSKLVSGLISDKFGLEQLIAFQQITQQDAQKVLQVNNSVNKVVTIILVFLFLVVLVITVIVVRNRRRRSVSNGEDVLLNALALRKSLKTGGGASDFFRSRLDQARRWLAAARVRRIYQQLMEICEKLDSPRLPAFTPLEFLPQVVKLFPEQQTELELITQTYNRVRYGEVPETYEEMHDLVNAWNVIKTTADPMIKDRKRRLQRK
jgi:hypothetical protein